MKILLNTILMTCLFIPATYSQKSAGSTALKEEEGVHALFFKTHKDGTAEPLAMMHDDKNHSSHNKHAATLFIGDFIKGIKDQQKKWITIKAEPEGFNNKIKQSAYEAGMSLVRKTERISILSPTSLPTQITKGFQDIFSHVKENYSNKKK
jgi:hypothetical protein